MAPDLRVTPFSIANCSCARISRRRSGDIDSADLPVRRRTLDEVANLSAFGDGVYSNTFRSERKTVRGTLLPVPSGILIGLALPALNVGALWSARVIAQ